MRRTILPILAITALCAVQAGCTANGNPLIDTGVASFCCNELGGHSAGFWLGLWHGLIAPVTFLISLFSSNTNIYEVHNNGGWYNAGFLLGLVTILGGSGGAAYSGRGGGGGEIVSSRHREDWE